MVSREMISGKEFFNYVVAVQGLFSPLHAYMYRAQE